jgi:hypothetical protein
MKIGEFLEKSEKARTSISFIIKVIVIISVLYAVYFHLWRILFINVLLLILIFMPFFLKKSTRINFPTEFEFVLLIFVVISFFLGEFRGFVIQVFFGLAIGFIGFTLMTVLYRNSKIKPNVFLIVLFAFCFSLALGAASELAKYYLKVYFSLEISVGDHLFAMQSLSLVAIGAVIAAVLGFVYLKGPKIKILSEMAGRFKKKNPNLFSEHSESPEEVLQLIKKGESEKLEFKTTLRTNLHTGEFDKKVELASLKTIVAFLNSEGGTLLIGVSDAGTILGIERDHFQNLDSFNLHFTNLLKEHIGNEYLPFINSELVLLEDKNILKVECRKSNKPVFLKINKDEEFYIRVGPASVCIRGSKLIDYIKHNF